MMKFVMLFIFISVLVSAQQRPEHFQPFDYKYSVQELRQCFSRDVINKARRDMQELEQANNSGDYQAELPSLATHPTPDWYIDAKLGIFFDWGLYSVAGYGEKGWSRARYPDWYLHHMYTNLRDYHETTWGADFERDDFIPMFTAKHFDAAKVVELCNQAGARYLVPFSKHHDGYCLWDCAYTHRDAVNMSPGRDSTAGAIRRCKNTGPQHR
ncbi:MAG: alpha-L-fucosidase [candidate division KSB1 bacterium]|nr:alpha-L-fucosidase [candidate division KSB1 bacterium]